MQKETRGRCRRRAVLPESWAVIGEGGSSGQQGVL